MRVFAVILATLSAAAAAGPAEESAEVRRAQATPWQPISHTAFADSIHHARMKFEGRQADYPQFTPDQIVHIAENLLAGQNQDGGWPKNQDWTRADGIDPLRGGKSTFDNRTTWSQIDYLARVHQRTGLKRYAKAAIRGLEYILQQQRPSGGWRGADVEAITFNDDVMAGILSTLKAVMQQRELYQFVDDRLLDRIGKAYLRGLNCVLESQVRVGTRLTVWGQQHDHETLAPVWARSYEPPSLVTAESVGVVEFLMSIEDPSPQVIAAIESAVAWFDRVKITGLRIEEVPAEPVQFRWHWSDTDRVEIADPKAPPIWARFYHLETETPLFCMPQRNRVKSYRDLSRERRTGYRWYGSWPADLLHEAYPAWRTTAK
jgi:PelA/Pel-15E family pectate lyase